MAVIQSSNAMELLLKANVARSVLEKVVLVLHVV